MRPRTRVLIVFSILCFLVGVEIGLIIDYEPLQPITVYSAAGDRKVVIQEIHISTGNPVPWSASWQMFVEDKIGQDRYLTGGITSGNFGSVATFNAMTGAQMRSAVKSAVQADTKVPSNDSVN